MANTTKTYTIEIQMDAAQQSLSDTNKKLAELDAQLSGLDRDTDAAKAIVAQMAKLAKASEVAGAQVSNLSSRLDAMKPGTIGALRTELKDLRAQLDNVAEGSAEANEILARMGDVRGSIKGLRDEVNALDPEKQLSAFVSFGEGVVGAFGVATVAAEAFGLSSASAEEFIKKTQGVIAVLTSLDAVRNALDGETIKSIKGTLSSIKANFALGESYTLAGTKAKLASITTRQALLATGVGAIVVLVGLLIANFDTVKEYGAKIYEKFKPQFEAIGSLIGSVVDAARNLASTVSFGLIDSAAAHAVAVAKETADTLRGIAIQDRARTIKILEAGGQDTFDLKRKQLEEELALLKQGTAEEIQAYKDKQADIEVLDQAEYKRSADEFEKQRVEYEKKEADAAKQAATKRKAEAERRLAADYSAFKARNQALEKLQVIDAAERLRRDIEGEVKRQETLAALGAQMAAGAARIAAQTAAEQAERIKNAGMAPLSLTDTILVRLFGVDPGQLEIVKARIEAAAQAVNAALSAYYAQAQAQADQRVDEAQQRLSLASQALEANQKRQADTEAKLQTATGARRDFLLLKLAKERAEEEKLNAAKNRAAADEKKRLKESAQLQKESQRGALALAAAYAVLAAMNAIGEAAAIPFPANIPAIIVAGATVASAVFAGKALGNAFADGGFVTGPGGPRSDQVPAVLSNGEFVVNADATAKNRALLESMNANNNRVLPPGTQRLAQGGGGGSAAGADFAELVSTTQQLIALTQQLVGHAQTTAEKPALLIGPTEALAIEAQRQAVSKAEQSATL